MTAALPTLPERNQRTAEQQLEFQHVLERAIEGEVRFDTTSHAMYATDASVYQLMPLGVVIPRTREDVRPGWWRKKWLWTSYPSRHSTAPS